MREILPIGTYFLYATKTYGLSLMIYLEKEFKKFQFDLHFLQDRKYFSA